MKVSRKKIHDFQEMIFEWWRINRRDLPWRRTRDPYKILVSEIMLQQTQVSRVLSKYEEFLSAFPDVSELSRASTADIIRLWKGLGYNRRALYLKKAAEAVVFQYKGVFPDDEVRLTKLPGLGIYTARALMVFAFEKNVAMVDTNIRQIITHFFLNGLPGKEKMIQEIADALVPTGRSWEWHQALMDYGSLELHKVALRMKLQRKKTQPFTSTNRFFRGKMMDMLREREVPETVFISNLIKTYGKSKDFFHALIQTLISEGLMVRDEDTTIHLPS